MTPPPCAAARAATKSIIIAMYASRFIFLSELYFYYYSKIQYFKFIFFIFPFFNLTLSGALHADKSASPNLSASLDLTALKLGIALKRQTTFKYFEIIFFIFLLFYST